MFARTLTVRTATPDCGVEIDKLIFAIPRLLLCDLPTLLRFGSATLGDVGAPLQQDEPAAVFRMKVKVGPCTTVRDGKNHPVRPLGLGVELLTEIHEFKRAAERCDRRAGVALPAATCSLMVV